MQVGESFARKAQHYSNGGIEYRRRRTECLNGLGITVLYYADNDVSDNLNGVCADITAKLDSASEIEMQRGRFSIFGGRFPNRY